MTELSTGRNTPHPPPASARWEVLLAHFAPTVEAAGYGLMLSPIFDNDA
jgi:hypothetical protein